VIAVLGLKWNYGKPGLPCARRLNEHRFSALHSNLVAAEFLDQIQAEIQRSVHAPAAVDAPVLSHHQLGHPLYLGILFAEAIGQARMCGSPFAIEQARGSNQPDAGTNAGYGNSALVPAPKPRHNRPVVLNHVLDADSSGWYKDEVGLANGGKRSLGLDIDGPLTSYRTPIDRRRRYTKAS